MVDLRIPIPDASRQIAFHELLLVARQDWLIDAVTEALASVDAERLRSELVAFVPAESHRLLAIAGLPDEHLFPLPVVLEAKPSLVGYYRLLLGIPRKTFYASGTGMGRFKAMEEKGTIRANQLPLLPTFCIAMGSAMAELVLQLAPMISRRDLIELPVLTLGQQFQGANNNLIGSEAITGVFRSIAEILEPFGAEHGDTGITIANLAGRSVRVILASDPDVGVEEVRDGNVVRRLALEVKGGSDRSNQHNRIGEAEKSHIKARAAGYGDFWTIIHTSTLDDEARRQSPTTRLWFDAAQVLARSGPDWDDFRRAIAHVVGV